MKNPFVDPQPDLLRSFTTIERDSIEPLEGMIIYNRDTLKVERYQNGAWESSIETGQIAGGDLSGTLPNPTLDEDLLSARHAKVIADNNVEAGLLVIHQVTVQAGADADINITINHKIKVIDARLMKTGGGAGGVGTIQVLNAGSAITDALSLPLSDQTIVRAATINDANYIINAGGTLRITRNRTTSTNEACEVFVLAYRVS